MFRIRDQVRFCWRRFARNGFFVRFLRLLGLVKVLLRHGNRRLAWCFCNESTFSRLLKEAHISLAHFSFELHLELVFGRINGGVKLSRVLFSLPMMGHIRKVSIACSSTTRLLTRFEKSTGHGIEKAWGYGGTPHQTPLVKTFMVSFLFGIVRLYRFGNDLFICWFTRNSFADLYSSTDAGFWRVLRLLIVAFENWFEGGIST